MSGFARRGWRAGKGRSEVTRSVSLSKQGVVLGGRWSCKAAASNRIICRSLLIDDPITNMPPPTTTTIHHFTATGRPEREKAAERPCRRWFALTKLLEGFECFRDKKKIEICISCCRTTRRQSGFSPQAVGLY